MSRQQVRVVDIDDEPDADCSDEFFLLASNEAPQVGDADGPSLVVTSPALGDVAEACNEYTVEVSFLDYSKVQIPRCAGPALYVYTRPKIFFLYKHRNGERTAFYEKVHLGRANSWLVLIIFRPHADT